MTSKSESEVTHKVEAIPKDPRKKENQFFEAFKKIFIPRLKKQEGLALSYERAKLRKIRGEGEAKVEEAAKIASEIDQMKQKELKEFCEIIDSHFAEMDPSLSVHIKMAKLLQTNPQIVKQLEKVQGMLGALNLEKGAVISITANDSKRTLRSAPPLKEFPEFEEAMEGFTDEENLKILERLKKIIAKRKKKKDTE